MEKVRGTVYLYSTGHKFLVPLLQVFRKNWRYSRLAMLALGISNGQNLFASFINTHMIKYRRCLSQILWSRYLIFLVHLSVTLVNNAVWVQEIMIFNRNMTGSLQPQSPVTTLPYISSYWKFSGHLSMESKILTWPQIQLTQFPSPISLHFGLYIHVWKP